MTYRLPYAVAGQRGRPHSARRRGVARARQEKRTFHFFLGLWQITWSVAIKWGRIPGFKFVRADYLGFTNCGGRLPGFAKMLGQNTSAHFLQKVGQITWVGRLPSWWGRIPGHRQKWGAEYLGAAKSGAEYLGAAKSGADYLG